MWAILSYVTVSQVNVLHIIQMLLWHQGLQCSIVMWQNNFTGINISQFFTQ